MNIYFYKIPDNSDSMYRGIGFYTRYLVSFLEKEGIRVSYFEKEGDIDNHDEETVLHYPWLSPYFLTVPYMNQILRVITVHDLIPLKFPKQYPTGIKAKFVWQINKKILQQAKVIITDSLTSKNDIIRFCWPIHANKIQIIPLAPDPLSRSLVKPIWPQFFKNLSPKVKEKLKRVFVLYVGDVNPSKNLPMLIKACLKLKTPLVLVGHKIMQTGYDRNHPENQDLVKVQQMIKKYPDLIIPTGYITQDDLTNLYNLATIYCQPSLEEGFGLPVLDAMACGCPTAVSQTSALIEITKTDTFLFDPTSLESISQALHDGLSHIQARNKFKQAGLKRAKQYSWHHTAKQTIEAYKKLLDN